MTISGRPSSSCAGAVGDKVRVAVRVRPPIQRDNGSKSVTRVVGDSTIQLSHPDRGSGKSPKMFAFDLCFPRETNGQSIKSCPSSSSTDQQQQHIFEEVGQGLVENAFLGFNCCVFAYGQTGSGKSYTMMGTPEEPGLIPRLCSALFARAARESGSGACARCTLALSFYEVYNERIRDLLSDARGPNLRVREHTLLGPMVEGLSVFVVTSYAQIERLIEAGNATRTTASTLMNETSSRSHSVFTLKLTQTIADADDNTFTGEKVSKISLVDLAGSERVQKTGAVGKRLEEGGNINKSLTALGKVIAALAATDGTTVAGQQQFVPYRDSVLTWLLKENLGGNSRTTMIATISPDASNYEETLSTLRFADRAKRIQTHAVVNEDPNAKILRELREEVERLRLLNETHAMQNEAYQQAMGQIAQRHREDKARALEQQYEQFSKYIRELTGGGGGGTQLQNNNGDQTPSMTPMTPFLGGMPWSSSMANGFGTIVNPSNKTKFLAWAQRREALFAARLGALRRAIRHAATLAADANALAARACGSRATQPPLFSVSLHIPAGNLRPVRLLGKNSAADSATENDEEDGEEDEKQGSVCEPIIVCSWRGRRAAQQWTVEQMECKLAELRASTSSSSLDPAFPLFGNFLTRREKHSLIGVANIYLGHLLESDELMVDSQALVINQQSEICGKLYVQVRRMTNMANEDDEDEEDEEVDEAQGNGGRPERMLGRKMLCRVELQKATSLPPDHSQLVFCQYTFHDRSPVVVPSNSDSNDEAEDTVSCSTNTVPFNTAHEFDVVCTKPLLDWIEQDALSIELWGHRRRMSSADALEDDHSPEEDEEEDDLRDDEDEMGTKMMANGNRHGSICELVERKKMSLRERWGEVTRRIELWLELLELNADGEYVPVPVEQGMTGTGGMYRLRHGQQRRLRIHVGQTAENHGTLPLRLMDIESISIGSVLVYEGDYKSDADPDRGGLPDSYQERDLVRLRDQWSAVLQRRAAHLQKEIQGLASSGLKGPLQEERERALLLDWVELVEERNAISVPGPGIPGAPDGSSFSVPGMEQHCPLIFLQDDKQEDGDGNDHPAGWHCLLNGEDAEGQYLELAMAEKDMAESSLTCVCPWDSSLHNFPALNRTSRIDERIFLIVRVTVSVSHPYPIRMVLRKRICLNIGAGITSSSSSLWPWTRRNTPLYATGLRLDIVACIPKCALDLEQRAVLAKLAVQNATELTGQDRENGNNNDDDEPVGLEQDYLSEYVSKTVQAVEWLIKLDKLRQEDAISRALARYRRQTQRRPPILGAMTRTISLPTTMANFLSPPSTVTTTVNSSSTFHRMPFSRQATVTPTLVAERNSTITPGQYRNCRAMLASSQSHTDGFNNNNTASSPASSGYASMDGASSNHPASSSPSSGCTARPSPPRPSSLNLSGSGFGMRKTMSMSFPPAAGHHQMNSIVSPCAFRLAGIDEEDNTHNNAIEESTNAANDSDKEEEREEGRSEEVQTVFGDETDDQLMTKDQTPGDEASGSNIINEQLAKQIAGGQKELGNNTNITSPLMFAEVNKAPLKFIDDNTPPLTSATDNTSSLEFADSSKTSLKFTADNNSKFTQNISPLMSSDNNISPLKFAENNNFSSKISAEDNSNNTLNFTDNNTPPLKFAASGNNTSQNSSISTSPATCCCAENRLFSASSSPPSLGGSLLRSNNRSGDGDRFGVDDHPVAVGGRKLLYFHQTMGNRKTKMEMEEGGGAINIMREENRGRMRAERREKHENEEENDDDDDDDEGKESPRGATRKLNNKKPQGSNIKGKNSSSRRILYSN